MEEAPSQSSIQHIKNIIGIRSTEDNPQALTDVIDYMQQYINQHHGITIERFLSGDKPSLLAYKGNSRPEEFKVLLNGHLDVVPANPKQFDAFVKDGRLYGRGTLDMKAAAFMLTEVFCELAESLPYDVGLQLVTDEEIGGHHGTNYQLQQGVKTDFILAGEQTALDINNAEKGLSWVRVTLRGQTGHGAYPWDGDNALVKATKFVNKVMEVYPNPKEEIWRTTANIAQVITSNDAFNRIPDETIVEIDFRYTQTDPHFASPESIITFLQSLDTSAEVEVLLYEPVHFTPEEDNYIKTLKKAVYDATGKTSNCINKHGASDVRFYNADGAAAVAFGPGGDGMHADVEYVTLQSLADYKKALQYFLKNLM